MKYREVKRLRGGTKIEEYQNARPENNIYYGLKGTPKHGALERDNDDSSKLGNHNYELWIMNYELYEVNYELQKSHESPTIRWI